ncbi:MAG: alcohol dehydrogenase [Gammaproteobacteria bacterium SG8_31]|nr:MAG: alcohol dehydrogenase [Gammaproteobacteria bacterium SG8_31]
MGLVGNWNYPTRIRFGSGRITELAEACADAGIRRPLLVTDRGLANLPITARVLEIMEGAGLGRSIFSDVDPNPVDKNLENGSRAFLDGDFDGVIAMGGGSGLDLAKLIAFASRQTRPVWDFEDVGDNWTRADAEAIAPVVAIPTTAGTGSEVGRAAVVTNSGTHAKKIIFHPRMMPSVVICDAELTIDLPPAMTAGTGMDAFVHCLEAYCAPAYHPMAQGVALEGIRLVKEFLPRAFRDGSDIEARANMMSAAAMGATAFQRGLGAIHSLAHAIGALHNTHHGTTNAVLTPAVLRFNRPAVETQIDRLAAYLGIPDGFDGFHAFVVELNRELRIPENLRALGADTGRIEEYAKLAIVDPTAPGNPVPLTLDAAIALYEKAI